MAKDPVVTIDQIIKNLAPKVRQVVKEHSALLWRQVLTRHLTGGTSSDRLGRRTGTMARATRPIPVKMEGSKVTGGLSFGAEYAWTHVGPSGSKVTIRPKNKSFLAIPLAAAKTAAGVARGGPTSGIWGPTFIAQGIIFGFVGGKKANIAGGSMNIGAARDVIGWSQKIIPLFVLKRSVVVPRRIFPKEHLLDWAKPKFIADLSKIVVGA